MIKFVEMDAAVTVADQLKEDDGNPVVLINTFTVSPEDTDALLAVWGRDAAVMQRQPGVFTPPTFQAAMLIFRSSPFTPSRNVLKRLAAQN